MSNSIDGEQRNLSLDGWRGLAVVFVLLGHFVPIPHMEMGAFGVQLFFVLSGRLMAEILFIKRVDVTTFYWRRLARILPVLYLYLVILTIFYLVNSYQKLTIFFDATPKSIFASATFTYNYLLHVGFGAAICDHIWSLCVEEHSYLILGALAAMTRVYKFSIWQLCIVLAAACMANGAYLSMFKHLDVFHVYWRTDTQAGGILLGCGLFLLARAKPKYFLCINPWVWALLAACAFALNTYTMNHTIRFSLGTLVLAILVVTIERSGHLFKFILENRLLRFFGRVSFSIYVFQQPFELNKFGHNLLALICAILIGIVVHYLIERPARSALNKVSLPIGLKSMQAA